MAIWAIADLHLSFGVVDKPMNVFGQNWDNYEEKIKANWLEKIKPEDIVILAGDFSWGMYLAQTKPDFDYLTKLPGKKVMIKGNHDYWWETLSKMNKFKKENNYENIEFIHNTCVVVDDVAICGTRGWELGTEELDEEQDKKVYAREIERLRRSLELGKNASKRIVVTHYNVGVYDEYIQLLKEYGVKLCIFGHLHGKVDKAKLDFEKEGIHFLCTACDQIDFNPIKIS
ncbi:MAG: metallophosphoesterase [Clostridia bacterium]|nr:metallophosphoesterase [Clostridia bacterium]